MRRERWPLVVAGLAIACWTLALGALAVGDIHGVSWPDFTIALAYPAVALLVTHVRSARTWCALTLVSALFSALNVAATGWADRLYRLHSAPVPGASWAAWLAGWSWVVSVAGFAAIAFFPYGRLPSRRWWPAPIAVFTAAALVAVANATGTVIGDYGVPNPLPGPHIADSSALSATTGLVGLGGLIGCLAAGVVTFRGADTVGRRQIGWYAYGYGVTLVLLILAVTTDVPDYVVALGPVAIAVAGGVAILRYRLYDIDLLFNRTLTWGLLTLMVVALYVVSVGFFQRLLSGRGSVGGLLATAVVAVAFQPVRSGVQRSVNQLIYGYRDQPETVLAELAQSLRSDDPLRNAAGTLVRIMRLPGVAVDCRAGGEAPARYAVGAEAPVTVAEAVSGGTQITISVRPRGHGGVSGRDRALLVGLAPTIAAAGEAVRLNRALEAARLRAVGELAEEQRRLRRDLHDGVGPLLGGLRLTIGAACRLIPTAPHEATAMLADAQSDAEAALDDIRRMAHDLRPPSLDELGLVAALRDRAERVAERVCRIEVIAGDIPDPLPAAVEVAAYRIATEAVLNAARHAQPTWCRLTLCGRDGGIEITVADDGVGLPAEFVPHVGLRSIRERAEELGGRIAFDVTTGGGTTVRAWLPCTHQHDLELLR